MLEPHALRNSIALCLLFVALAATSIGCGCPPTVHEIVTLQMLQEEEANNAYRDASANQGGDAGDAGDGGVSLASITTVTDANCGDVCRYVYGDSGFVSCTVATDAGGPAADCVYTAICG